MAVEKKRMQQRYGTYTQYLNDKDNLLPNEFASVTSGDPNTEDGSALYFKSGTEEPKRVLQEGDVYSSAEIDNLLTEKANSGGVINTTSLNAISGKTAKQFLNAYSYIYDAYGNILSYTANTVITANSFNIATEDKANKFYICLGSTVTKVQPYAFTPIADNIIAIYVENIKDNVTFSDTTVTSKVTYRQSPLMNFYMLASLAKLHKDKYSLYTKDESKTRFASTSTILFDANKIPLKTSSANTISAGFATGNAKLVTAFVSKNVSKIGSGAFANCVNLTDIYIDNTEGKVTIETSAIPDTVNIHYSDTFNSVDYLMQALTAVNTALSNKLDNVTGAVATVNIADKAVTSDKLDSSLMTTINNKYDKSNVEKGTGTLTAYTASTVVNTITYDYQKVGNFVTIAFSVTFTDGNFKYTQMTGLPYILTGVAKYSNTIVTIHTNLDTIISIYPVGSWLTLRPAKQIAVTESTQLYFTITYEVK